MNALTGSASVLADWGGHMDWGNGWGIAMMIGMILFWALVIVGIVWVFRTVAGGQHTAAAGHAAAPTALEVLDRRLAEGGISIEEYEERRRILTGSSSSDSP